MSDNSTYQPNFALLFGLAWLAIASQLLWLDWTQTANALGDSDDAMRLVEVRAFLTGRGWFDLHEPRLQPPMGYDTHWSRLIDAGLAGLFLVFHAVFDTAHAERLTRVVWPLLWLVPAMAGTAALAWRLGGRAAAIVVLLLLLFGLPAFIQFGPGRIDHHDVQITLALLTLAAAIWSDRVRGAAWAAGALSGLALAIGFEGMPFIVLAGTIFAARFAIDRKYASALSQYGESVAASTALFFLISVAPGHWTQTACDAIAINSAAPAALGGIALFIAARRFAGERLFVRCVAIAVACGLAAAIFVILEPRCLAGPLALVDPAVLPIWLAGVREAQPLIATMRLNPTSGAGIAIYPVAALVCAIVLARDARLRRDSGFIAATAALLASIVMTIVAVRAAPYTIWLGMPFVAAALLRLFNWLKLATLPARAFTVLPFTPMLLSFGVIVLVEKIVPDRQMKLERGDDACFKSKSYAPLAKLPAGRVVTDVDYGPFVLALTSHSVLAAPYHRLSYGIVASYRSFATPPDEAHEILRQANATYVMICGVRAPLELTETERARSLWTVLKAGNIPDWLEPMPDTGPLGVYRFKP
jgi:hypothetical protein